MTEPVDEAHTMSSNTDTTTRTDASLIDLLVVLLRFRYWFLILPVILVVFVFVVTVLQRRTYSARASFLVQSSQPAVGNLSSLASQFGFSIGGGEGNSPDFYADLALSRVLLERVVDSVIVRVEDDHGETSSLMWVLVPDGDGSELHRYRAVRDLLSRLTVESSRLTSVVVVTVSLDSPILAQEVAARILQEIDVFNQVSRQSQARHEREFVEQRLSDTRLALRGAEDSLQAFLSENRVFQQSPQLVFENDRLRRSVLQHQQVETTLAQAYEKARIDEVRSTPVITVVEPALPPVRPDPRHLLLRMLLAVFGGLLLATIVVAWKSMLLSSRERDPAQFAALETQRRQLREDLRGVVAWLPLRR